MPDDPTTPTENNSQALVREDPRTALVVTNPRVIQIAKRLRWRPETAIARIKKALPIAFEQQLYLAIGPTVGILPESMDKLLRMFIGHRNFGKDDLDFKKAGKNLVISRLSEFSDFLRETLHLLKIVKEEVHGFSISVEHAGQLVLDYGVEDPERLIEMVDCQLEQFCAFLQISTRRPYAERLRICIWIMVKEIIPMNKARGAVDPLDLSDFLAMGTVQSQEIKTRLQDQIDDYTSGGDSQEIPRHGDFSLSTLRRMGVID